jgi:hypothetical protein
MLTAVEIMKIFTKNLGSFLQKYENTGMWKQEQQEVRQHWFII